MPLTVLVVDDIAPTRDALCAKVRDLGHEAHAAEGGAQALSWLATHRADLVLLDLLMPEVSGFEVCRRIRTIEPDRWLPLIVTSSLQGEHHFIQALASGADDYLVRPVAAAMLKAKLDHFARVLALQAHTAGMAQRQRDILDNILDPVLTVNNQDVVVEANHAACRRFGAGLPTCLIGQPVRAVTGADLAQMLGRPPLVLRGVDGHAFPAEVSASSWKESGHSRTTLVVRDLSERQRNERMRDEFLATVSHELRTPLTSILGAVALLDSGAAGALPAAAAPLMGAAKRNGERLSRLIDDVLDLTKLEGDRMVLHARRQAMAPLVQEAVAANQAYAESAGVRLLFDADVAAGCAEAPLDGDRFLQVMANLLSNAIKHSPRGEAVQVQLHTSAEGWRVSVRDRGPGVSPDFQQRLFQKFSQADGGDRRIPGGTGLGLYITRMLVERMGGQIGVDSRPGDGATFSIWFPAQVEPSPHPHVVLIEHDADARARVADGLGGVARLTWISRVSQATAEPREPCALVLANPQGQGPVDAFCAAVRRVAGAAPVVLVSDSVDPGFATSQGFGWMSASRADATSLRQAVITAMGRRARAVAH